MIVCCIVAAFPQEFFIKVEAFKLSKNVLIADIDGFFGGLL